MRVGDFETAVFACSSIPRMVSDRQFAVQRAMPMQALSATAVATLILFVADQFLNAGRYSEVVAHALKHAALLVGIDV
jgi:hypothetical protein